MVDFPHLEFPDRTLIFSLNNFCCQNSKYKFLKALITHEVNPLFSFQKQTTVYIKLFNFEIGNTQRILLKVRLKVEKYPISFHLLP